MSNHQIRKNIRITIILTFFIFTAIAIIFFVKDNSNTKEGDMINQLYHEWKHSYVEKLPDGTCRVIDPQQNNITVSEGIGYGMMFSAFLEDQETFDGLLNYEKKYEDQNHLMNWKVDSSSQIVGTGSATDADEDMAYALLRAYSVWQEDRYLQESLTKITSIKKYEINGDFEVLPGDQWGSNAPYNPSYVAPYYYALFEKVSEDEDWSTIQTVNLKKLHEHMNQVTGFLPDWISKGKVELTFGYDAVRIPLRLLSYSLSTDLTPENKELVSDILKKQGHFIIPIGSDHVLSEYSLDGKSSAKYINTAYLASYYSMIYYVADEADRDRWKNLLCSRHSESYYGDSLRLWVLLITEIEKEGFTLP